MSARSSAVALARKATSFAGTIVHVNTEAPEFVLTYDDGPVAGNTDRIIELLAAREATATFFMLLGRVRADPGLLRAVADAGHEIALHGIDHKDVTKLPLDEVRRRMRDGRRELEDIAARTVRWYRPPYGHQTYRVWREVRSAGLTPVMWGPSTRDARPDFSLDDCVASALQGATRGTILLAHDNYADAADGVDDGPAPTLNRVELLTRILDRYAELGLAARSLDDALRSGTPKLEGRFKR